jgi:PadR family transcriptional regulator
MDDRFLYAGLIRLHLLHHAAQEPIYGLAMMKELGRHGYRLSAGTLYPILHGLEAGGYLTSTKHRIGKTLRRVYRATPAGRRVLKSAKLKVSELFGEMFEDDRQGRRRAMRRAEGRAAKPHSRLIDGAGID